MSNLSILFEGKPANERKAAAARVCEMIKAGKIERSKLSVQDAAVSTLGRDVYESMMRKGGDGAFDSVKESADPVNLSAFLDITGNIALTGLVEAYNAPEFIGTQLVTEETDASDLTRIPGLSPIDDNAIEVNEAEEYPTVKFGEDYIDRPTSVKRGLKIALTREIVHFDRTGKLIEMAMSVGERLAKLKDDRILRVVCGLDNTFKRKGVARNTYVSSADPRINKAASMELIDWTTLEKAYLLFAQMNDDREDAEPIEVHPTTILMTPFKRWTAERIIGATEIETPTSTSDENTLKTRSSNPAARMSLKVLDSMRLYAMLVRSAAKGGAGLTADQAKNYWWYGDFKRAFAYCTMWPLALRAAGAQHDDDFDRDVVAQFRADERGVAYVRAPWHVAEFNKD